MTITDPTFDAALRRHGPSGELGVLLTLAQFAPDAPFSLALLYECLAIITPTQRRALQQFLHTLQQRGWLRLQRTTLTVHPTLPPAAMAALAAASAAGLNGSEALLSVQGDVENALVFELDDAPSLAEDPEARLELERSLLPHFRYRATEAMVQLDPVSLALMERLVRLTARHDLGAMVYYLGQFLATVDLDHALEAEPYHLICTLAAMASCARGAAERAADPVQRTEVCAITRACIERWQLLAAGDPGELAQAAQLLAQLPDCSPSMAVAQCRAAVVYAQADLESHDDSPVPVRSMPLTYARGMLAQALLRAGEGEEAEQVYQEAIAEYPLVGDQAHGQYLDAFLWAVGAALAQRRGDPAVSLAQRDRAIQICQELIDDGLAAEDLDEVEHLLAACMRERAVVAATI